MKLILIPLFFVFSSVNYPVRNKIIYIQPLGTVNQLELNVVKNTVESFYGYTCVYKTPQPLTSDLLSESKSRYEANKILKKYKSTENIILITEKDIVHHDKKRNVKEWGIIGLGYRPGSVCVVSTYRIKRGISVERFHDRLRKVSLHEIGHNLGLDHCTKSKECLMNDARGTVKTIDNEKLKLCDFCKKQIN